MSYLPRLLKILSTTAKYRLDLIPVGVPTSPWLRLLIFFAGLRWIGNPVKHLPEGERLRLAFEELGPIYIKLGQLLSTRRDFLPLELVNALQGLQDNVPPFSSPTIEELILATLGRPWQDIFATLDTRPLASASIAQVHAATLLTGEEVVIKVLRPDIERTILEDIRVLRWLAIMIERHVPDGQRLRAREVVADYEGIILGELNLLMEGANATQLRRNFEYSPLLYVPKIYWDFSRQNMLVMERIYGVPVSDTATLLAHNIDLKRLAEIGVEIFFSQVFEHSFFHADMHPGNIFVSVDKPELPQYIAVDCAIIGSLSHGDQQYLARNLLAIFKRDYRKVAELHVECGWVPPNTSIPQFESAMRSVCEPVFEKPLRDISFGYLLVQLFRTAGRFNMQVQPSLVLLQKTLLNVEGLGRELYPDLDLWTTALPYLESWNRRRMQPSTLFHALRENVPDWIEQLPQLPQLWLDSLGQQRKMQKQLLVIGRELQVLRANQVGGRRKLMRRNLIAGLILLLAALATLHPAVHKFAMNLPLPGVILGGLAVYLLCFRR